MLASIPLRIRSRPLGPIAMIAVCFAFQTAAISAKPLPGELAKKSRAMVLQPASQWQIQLTNERCLLARQFKSPKGPGVVMIEQLAPGEVFDLTIAGPNIAGSHKGAWFYAGMRSDQEMRTIDPLEFAIAGYETALAMPSVQITDKGSLQSKDRKEVSAEITLIAASKIDRIVFQRSTAIVSFETGNMKEPFDALNDCASRLLAGWGLSKQEHQSYAPARMPKERSFFERLHHEFATASGNRGNEALLRVRAMINADGTVSDCFHELSLQSGDYQRDVCREISEMKFEPATDIDGKPIASFHSVSYILSRYDPWKAGAHGRREN